MPPLYLRKILLNIVQGKKSFDYMNALTPQSGEDEGLACRLHADGEIADLAFYRQNMPQTLALQRNIKSSLEWFCAEMVISLK